MAKVNVKKNLTYNLMYQVLIIIIPLITTPYISRIIGKEGVGIYSYTYSVANYFVLFSLLGINNYGNRIVAKYKDDKEKLSLEFISLYTFQFITSAIMICVYYIYISCFDNKYFIYSIVQSIYVISAMAEINWLFFGLEKFKLTVIRNTIIKTISTICIFVFVKKADDLIIYTLILASSSLLSQMSLWPFVKKEIKFVKPKIKDITKHIKPDFILFIPVIAVSLYKIMDKIMLGNMSEVAQVGLYDSAEKIISIPITFITAFGTVMLPRATNLLSNNDEEKVKEYLKNSIMILIFISIPITLGLITIANKLTNLYFGIEFSDASGIMQILSISIVFMAIANVIRTQYLIPKEKDKEYIISVFCGAIINLIINAFLIPIYKAKGAAIGTVFAEFSVFALQLYFFKEKKIIYQNWKKILQFIISAIIMYLVINQLGYYIKNDVFCILIQVTIGAITYFAFNAKFIIKMLPKRKKQEKLVE